MPRRRARSAPRARHRPGLRGQGRPAGDPVFDLQNPDDAGARRSSACCAHHNALRAGSGEPPRSTAARCDQLCRDRADFVLPFMDSGLGASRQERRAGRRILFEGAQGACSTSTTAPIRSSPRPTPSPPRPRPDPASGRAPSPTCWASPRPTPRASAPGRSRPSRPTRSASARRARPRVRHRHGAQAPLRLVRRGAGAPGHQDRRHQRHRADQARRARRLEEIKVCVGYRLDGKRSTGCRRARGPRCGSSRSTSFEGWKGSSAGARSLGRPAGAGGQIRAPDRGTDRVPGGAAVHQPGARRHDPSGKGPSGR
jgi:hypothetical protein